MAASARTWRRRHGIGGVARSAAGPSGGLKRRSFRPKPERYPARHRLRSEPEILRDHLGRGRCAEAVEPDPERLAPHDGAPGIGLRRLDDDEARALREHRPAVLLRLGLKPL